MITWESIYSRVQGDLPVENLAKFAPHKGNDPTSFVRFEIDVTTAGKFQLSLGDATGLALWVDGKPSNLTAVQPVELAVGRHVFTVAINRVQHSSNLRIELQDAPGSTAQAQLVGGK
jgi:hypothetical protein